MTDPPSPYARCATHDYHQDSACAISLGETCQLHDQTFCELHVGWAPILIGERQINGHDVGHWPSIVHHRPYHGLTRDGAFRFGPGRRRMLECGARWHRSANLLWCSTPGDWDAKEAERWATRLRSDPGFRDHKIAYLAGRRVAAAFGFQSMEMYTWRDVGGQRFVLLPHPSGRNRIWNDPQTIESAREGIRQALEAGPVATCSLAEVMQLAERWLLPVRSVDVGDVIPTQEILFGEPAREVPHPPPVVLVRRPNGYEVAEGDDRVLLALQRGDKLDAVICEVDGSKLRVV